MTSSSDKQTIGFLAALEDGEGSWLGGYLVTDLRGNPLRFCRTREKVSVSKLERVLLGRSYERHLFCDLMGKCLVEEDGQPVSAILCDRAAMLDLRKLIPIQAPVLAWHDGRLQTGPDGPRDQDREVIQALEEGLDLIDGPLEVFDRIRVALKNGDSLESAGA